MKPRFDNQLVHANQICGLSTNVPAFAAKSAATRGAYPLCRRIKSVDMMHAGLAASMQESEFHCSVACSSAITPLGRFS